MKLLKREGFTLIEMLIVIGIIGVLASIILVGTSGSRAGARDAKRISEVRQMQNAEEVYYLQNGTYADKGALIAFDSKLNDLQYRDNITLSEVTNFAYKICVTLEGNVAGVQKEGSDFCVTQ